MNKILALILSLVFSCSVWAQPLPPPGVDYLAGNMYQSVMLKTHPKKWAAGIFLRTFRDARKTVRAMACSGNFSDIVVHLAPFDRSHAYPIKALMPQIIADAKWLQQVATDCPQATLMPSPFCEHNHPTKNIKPVLDAIRKAAPSTLPVNTIWRGGQVYGYITEMHLADSKPRAPPRGDYTVSFDGFGGDGSGDFTDADIESILRRYSTARHVRLWNFRYNGKFGHKDPSDIAHRKSWPDEKYMLGHNAMMKAREGGITWQPNALYKPFADDHGIGGKDNKAMAILPGRNVGTVRVFDRNGKQIDSMQSPKLNPAHNGEPKGIRYYSTRYAYEIAQSARKNTGSGLIRIEGSPLTDGDLRSGRLK